MVLGYFSMFSLKFDSISSIFFAKFPTFFIFRIDLAPIRGHLGRLIGFWKHYLFFPYFKFLVLKKVQKFVFRPPSQKIRAMGLNELTWWWRHYLVWFRAVNIDSVLVEVVKAATGVARELAEEVVGAAVATVEGNRVDRHFRVQVHLCQHRLWRLRK